MGLLDIFRRRPPAEPTSFGNDKEFRAFILAETQDEQMADLLVEIATHVGRDGYLEIKQSGQGQPYSVEYTPCPDDGREQSEVQAQYRALKHQIATAPSDSERDQLQRELACLCGGFCTVHINTSGSFDFETRRALIGGAWARCQEIWTRDEGQ